MLTASRRIFMKIRVVKYIGVVLGLAFSIASPAFAQEGDLPSDDLPCVILGWIKWICIFEPW
jgi:hypothetical protein